MGGLFAVENVAAGFAEQFIAWLAVDAYPELVAHCAGGDERRVFFAQQVGDAFFESADGRVLAEDVVAHFGGGHRGPHGSGGAGERVATEVDHGGRLEAVGWRL